MNHSLLPKPGASLRSLITSTGYRPHFVQRGTVKDLDDQALEARRGSNYDLLTQSAEQWIAAIDKDGDHEWRHLVRSGWARYAMVLRYMARQADTRTLGRPARPIALRLVLIEIAAIIKRATAEIPSMHRTRWWESPFAHWLQAAQAQTGLPARLIRDQLGNHRDVDVRTLERWQNGEPIGKLSWPYLEAVRAAFQGSSLSETQTKRLTGWLAMVVWVQSFSQSLRKKVSAMVDQLELPKLRTLDQVVEDLHGTAAPFEDDLVQRVGPVVARLNQLLRDAKQHRDAIEQRLSLLHSVCEVGGPTAAAEYRPLWLLMTARYYARVERKEQALSYFEQAHQAAWWRGGPIQHDILREALCYAVGVNDKVRSNQYWDDLYLLGLNTGPKSELDNQHMRRLSREFNRVFAPLKAVKRIPPPYRGAVMDQPFKLSAKDLANPNRISAEAEGSVRYSVFMRAIMFGTLADVKALVAKGASMDRVVEESGEHPLVTALRRAEDTKDLDVVRYLLTLPIESKTINLEASTRRQTALWLAINIGDPQIVVSLLEKDADPAQACYTSPSSLIYAMGKLADCLLPDMVHQREAYLAGRTPADIYDASASAIFDIELAPNRQAQYAFLNNPIAAKIHQEVMDHYRGEAPGRRAVVMALLANDADPNCRYPDTNGHEGYWTPTLNAAQLGDLAVLKAMISAGGDPWLSLDNDSPLAQKDALWAATLYKQDHVVQYLMAYLQSRT